MSKLYVIMEGLISVTSSPAGDPIVLLVKTNPQDKDAMGQPLPPHNPRVTFRSGGKLTEQSLDGEDIQFLGGKPASKAVARLERLPSFAAILAYARNTNGHTVAQLAEINAGCLGNSPGTACKTADGKNPRLAGRVRIDQGILTSIQVDDNGFPYAAPPVRFQFRFMDDALAAALDMPCDNALLLKIDSGSNPIQLQIGAKAFPLDSALQTEKDANRTALDDPLAACAIVRITDMVDPMLMKQMKMDFSAEIGRAHV